MAGMNELLLLIYYHKSLESTWNDKEKQPKPIILFKFLHYYIFRIIQIEVIFSLADLNTALGLTLPLAAT